MWRANIILITVLFWTAPVWAEVEPSGKMRVLALQCLACHGENAQTDNALPSLARLPASYLIQALREFKSGQRLGTLMPAIVAARSDREIVALARALVETWDLFR